MQAIAVTLTNSKPYVEIEHKGKTLKFVISPLGVKNFGDDEENKFLYINQYWASLSDQQQNAIFEIYEGIDCVFDSNSSKEELNDQLSDLIADLNVYHKEEDILLWMRLNTTIVFPEGIKDDYIHSIDDNNTKEKTYVKTEYLELLARAISLRTLVPIWGNYIDMVRGGVDGIGTEFKELNAFRLLYKSKEFMESRSMQKLEVYVEKIVGNDRYNPNNIHKGISSEDFCEWALASLCVKRLSIGSIQGIGPKANLISSLHSYIRRLVDGKDKNGENSISDKKATDEGSGNSSFNEKTSPLEKNRFKFQISPGDKAEMEHAMSDITKSAIKISNYRLTPDKVQQAMVTANPLNDQQVMAPQINIMRWMFRSIVSPRGMMYMPAQSIIVEALAASEALLWELGHPYLAVLVTSHPVMAEGINKIATIRVSANNSKMQIPDDLSDRIDRLFPFSKTIRPKKRDNNEPPRQDNAVVKAINNMADDLMMYTWRATCSEEKLKELFGSTSRRIPITPDIKILLAKLVIDLGERNIP